MNERELRDNEFRADMENALHQNRSLTMIAQTIWELAKAYADARVAETIEGWKITREHLQNQVSAKDTEIAELKAQVEGLKTDMQHSRLIEAAQVKESNELKAEIKRLRDFTEKCHKSPEKLVQVVWFADGSFDYWDLVPLQDAAAIALSPAPVTEGPKKTFSLQMYECNRCEWYGQVGESIETESYDVCPKCLSEDLTLLDSPKNEDQE